MSLIRTSRGQKHWDTGSVRKGAVTLQYPTKGSSAPTFSTPTSRDSDLTSPMQVSWLRLLLKVAELAVPWPCIVCARLNALVFVQCNSISSSLPTKLHYAFGKTLDLELPGAFRHTQEGFVDVYVMYRRLSPAV